MCSILHEYVLFFTIYTYVLRMTTITRASYFNFVFYSLNQQRQKEVGKKRIFEIRIIIEKQSKLKVLSLIHI